MTNCQAVGACEKNHHLEITKMTSFSIVTVTKNNFDGLKNTYHSLKDLIDDTIEWIVIDGGSNDETRAFLKTTPAIWISEPDNGLYDAMNKGLSMAQNDYVWFMNAGDCFAGTDIFHAIRTEMAYCRCDPDFIYGDFIERSETGTPFYRSARKFDKHAPLHMFTSHQAMIYRRDTCSLVRFDTDYAIAADYKFTVEHLRHGARILYCDMPLCIFEQGGVSQLQNQKGRSEQFKIRKEFGITAPMLNTALYIGQSMRHKLKSAGLMRA